MRKFLHNTMMKVIIMIVVCCFASYNLSSPFFDVFSAYDLYHALAVSFNCLIAITGIVFGISIVYDAIMLHKENKMIGEKNV